MIFKIVKYPDEWELGVSDKHGRTEERVVPYKNLVFEAERAYYSKIRVYTWKQLQEYTENFDSLRFPFGGIEQHPEGEQDEWVKENGVEFIILELYNNGFDFDDACTYCFRESNLYVMNNEGKTVDSISCQVA